MGDLLGMLVPFAMTVGLVLVVITAIRKRGDTKSEYLYRKDQEHYYFDNGKLVVNVPLPYRPWAVPVDEIDDVVVIYNFASLGKSALGFHILKKDGSAAKGPGFVVYTHQFSLEDTLADLRSHGLQCRSDTRGKIL